MDLPTCPHCKQSVLDEDAELCPFCDQPMKGPATSAPAAVKEPPKKAAPKLKPSEKPKKTDGDDDDPFELERATVKKVVQLQRKPSKGRMWRLVCPMCETNGFAPKGAAGREVKCANPECLVPVFTAPKPEKEKAAEPEVEKPKKSNLGMIVVVVVVLCAAGGGGAWFVLGQPDVENNLVTNPGDIPKPVVGAPPITDVENGTDTNNTNPGTQNPNVDTPPKADFARLKPNILAAMVKVARERERNRKAFCRRMSAEAYAVNGQQEEMQQQLVQLGKVGASLKYYGITALTEMVWQQRASGDSAAASQSLEEAMKLAENLPEYGLFALQASTELAVLLIVNDRVDDAVRLIGDQKDGGQAAQFTTMMVRATLTNSYNMDALASRQPLQAWNSPSWLLVTVGLATRGEIDRAVAWVNSAPSPAIKLDCIIAFAETVANNSDQRSKVDGLLSSLSNESQALVLARMAASTANASEAKPLLDRASAALAKISVPTPIRLGTIKEVYGLTIPNDVPLRNGSLAAAEIVRAHVMSGSLDTVAESLTKSMQLARAIGPSQAAIRLKLEDFSKNGKQFIRPQIKAEFSLESDQEAERYVTMYRQQCRRLEQAADARFDLQVTLLRRAAEWGLIGQVWNYAKSSSSNSDINQKEMFNESSLMPQLLALAKAAGDSSAAEIEAASTGGQLDVKDAIRVQTQALVASGTIEDASKASQSLARMPINPEADDADIEKAWRDTWIMTLASRLVNSGNIRASVFFVGNIKDQLLREQAFLHTAANATLRGNGEEVWDIMSKSNRLPTEKAATYRGLIAGLALQ